MNKLFKELLDKIIEESLQVMPPHAESGNWDDLDEATNPPIAGMMGDDGDEEDLQGQESKDQQKLKNTAPNGEEAPADKAHDMGLTYKGHAIWQDKEGKSVAKTIGNDLVKLDKTGGLDQSAHPIDTDDISKYDADTQAPQVHAKLPALAKKAAQSRPTGKVINDPKLVGHIHPPLNQAGDPIEISVHGKPGVIDAFNPNDEEAIITFDDGKSEKVPRSDVVPKVPEDIKQMASVAAKTARGNHEGNHAMKVFGDKLKTYMDDKMADPDKTAKDMYNELSSAGLNREVIHKLMQGILEKMPQGPQKNKLSKLYWAVGQEAKPSLDKLKQSDMFPNLPPEPEPGLKMAKKSKDISKVDKSRFDQPDTMKIPAHTSMKKLDVSDFEKRLSQLHPEMSSEKRAKIIDLFRDYQGGQGDNGKFDNKKLRRQHKGDWDLK